MSSMTNTFDYITHYSILESLVNSMEIERMRRIKNEICAIPDLLLYPCVNRNVDILF